MEISTWVQAICFTSVVMNDIGKVFNGLFSLCFSVVIFSKIVTSEVIVFLDASIKFLMPKLGLKKARNFVRILAA